MRLARSCDVSGLEQVIAHLELVETEHRQDLVDVRPLPQHLRIPRKVLEPLARLVASEL